MPNTKISNHHKRKQNSPFQKMMHNNKNNNKIELIATTLPEILLITTYPPNECGIATYSHDLVKALNNKYEKSFIVDVCAIENDVSKNVYPQDVHDILNANKAQSYIDLASKINSNERLSLVLLQHEFGFFNDNTADLNNFMTVVKKPIAIVFHTVLPNPKKELRNEVNFLIEKASSAIVMTHNAARILNKDYGVLKSKIAVIAHGTHLVPHLDKKVLKKKYGLEDRIILSTFGLLGSGKNIETTLDALPNIVKTSTNVLFLIIGKTHPKIVSSEGEKYRQFLKEKIEKLDLQNHVKFVNEYLPLPTLLEYLQLTDVYVFTSNDPNQAVSGTFSYALSCGCPVVSTPIPHAIEVLSGDTGIIFDFGNAEQLSAAVNKILFDVTFRLNLISNGLNKITGTSWENTAVAYAKIFQKIGSKKVTLHYKIPEINLSHFKKMTTDFGILQFSIFNRPDINSGYTIDDNARALIAICQHFELTKEPLDLPFIEIYLEYIDFCHHENQLFTNYVDFNNQHSAQNINENLEDSTGRALWALGFVVSMSNILPAQTIAKAKNIFDNAIQLAHNTHSTRSMAFMIKGIYFYNKTTQNTENLMLINMLTNRLVQMYRHEATNDWQWFESYLTYANSVLSEAMLCAFVVTKNNVFQEIAKASFDFLLSKTFTKETINVVSNRTWHLKGAENSIFGQQPIDVAYTILALEKFYMVFKTPDYLQKMEIAFQWFLGNNYLQQIVYNPCTGGCFDGIEERNVNLNQGSESTVSYLMARLTVEKHQTYHQKQPIKNVCEEMI